MTRHGPCRVFLYDTTMIGRVFQNSGLLASRQKSHQYTCRNFGAAMIRGTALGGAGWLTWDEA